MVARIWEFVTLAVLLAAVAFARPIWAGTAELCFEPCKLANDAPTVNFGVRGPATDRLTLHHERFLTERDVALQRELADRSAPRTQIHVAPTVVIREKQHYSNRYIHRRRGR